MWIHEVSSKISAPLSSDSFEREIEDYQLVSLKQLLHVLLIHKSKIQKLGFSDEDFGDYP
jgi:hypothetical protein